MAGIFILLLLAAMAGSWLSRVLLLRTLRISHPHEFAELGQPSSRQLASILPRHQDLNLKFWKYLWGGKVLLLDDARVSGLAWAARICDSAAAAAAVAFLWSAGK